MLKRFMIGRASFMMVMSVGAMQEQSTKETYALFTDITNKTLVITHIPEGINDIATTSYNLALSRVLKNEKSTSERKEIRYRALIEQAHGVTVQVHQVRDAHREYYEGFVTYNQKNITLPDQYTQGCFAMLAALHARKTSAVLLGDDDIIGVLEKTQGP